MRRHPVSFTWTLAYGRLLAGRYERAIEAASRVKTRAPDRDLPRLALSAAYSAVGRTSEARSEAAELLRIDPRFIVSGWERELVDYKDNAVIDTVGGLLKQVGLPE